MDFVALDVETACPDRSSICQVGLVRFSGGVEVDSWGPLVRPRFDFSPANIAVHGIDARAVAGSPLFEDLASDITRWLDGAVVVAHSSFDRVAIERAFKACGLRPPVCRWLDTVVVARRAWPGISGGHGLANLTAFLKYSFRHHDALEDARAAAHVLVEACKATGRMVPDWIALLSSRSYSGHVSQKIRMDGNPDGPLFGEVLVFTGELSLPRAEAAQLAADAGCAVAANVTKKTTLLVVGDLDGIYLAGKPVSSKQAKALELAAAGHPIQLVTEADFLQLVSAVDVD